MNKDVMGALEKIAAEMWPGAPVIPEMETGASDSVYTMAAGIPSYGVSGLAVDRDDVRSALASIDSRSASACVGS